VADPLKIQDMGNSRLTGRLSAKKTREERKQEMEFFTRHPVPMLGLKIPLSGKKKKKQERGELKEEAQDACDRRFSGLHLMWRDGPTPWSWKEKKTGKKLRTIRTSL